MYWATSVSRAQNAGSIPVIRSISPGDGAWQLADVLSISAEYGLAVHDHGTNQAGRPRSDIEVNWVRGLLLRSELTLR